ncbi:hypothetical protein SDC9_200183 [bioreactor metagenome]|uniref:Uncharacterized protein n=1 Tax=bioreactor metagenome TaxID=1076179 RepID=A0A645IMI5_9ZZZZ
MEQFIQLLCIAPFQGGFFINISLMEHIDSNLHHCRTGTFSTTGLQQPELTVLNGELKVLHILEIILQFLLHFNQFFCTLGQSLFE